MINLLKKNIFIFSLTAMSIIAIVTFLWLVKFKDADKPKQQAVISSTTSDSKSLIKTSEVKQSVSTENELINVQGEDSNSSFHSLDFIDDQNGLIIEDKNTTPKQPSKLLITQDGGVHWEKTEIKDMIINKIKFINKTEGWAIGNPVDELTSDTKVAATKILHTQDGGKSWAAQWEKKETLTSNNDLWFQDALNGYALIGGIFLSTSDGGKNWSEVSFGIVDFLSQHMSFVSAYKGWVIGTVQKTNSSNDSTQDTEIKLMVLQTIDGGKHWNKHFEKKYAEAPVRGIDIEFINASTGWFLTSDLPTWASELYYTSDGGINWSKVNQINCARPTPTELYFVTPQIGWIPLDVGAGPIAGGLMFTNDGGKTFERIGGENGHGIISTSEVYFTSQRQGWAIGMNPNLGNYIIHTVDGGKSWTQIYPKVSPIEDISFVDNNLGYGLGQFMDSGTVLKTIDGGVSWQSMYSFPKTFFPNLISFIDCNNGWVLGIDEENKTEIYKTSDGGRNWTQLKCDVSQIQESNAIYFHLFDLNNGIIINRDVNNICFYSTKDGGKDWYLSNQLPAKDANDFSIVSLNTGWGVDASRQNSYSLELSQTINGETWQSVDVVGSNMWPYGIEFISKNKGWILVQQPPFNQGSIMKLLSTSDGGKTWSTRQFPKAFKIETIRNQFPLQFTDEKHGWLLSRSGLLTTKDGGNTWNFLN